MRAILTWHSIDDSGSPISVDRDAFRAQVRWLASGRVRVVTVPELLALPDSADAVALTFDDGFANFAVEAAPLLRDTGLPATVFVVGDRVGLDNRWAGSADGVPILPLMDWEALGRLTEGGVHLAAHTRSHPHLTTLDRDRVRDELAGSAEVMQARLGRRPDGIAYPYGEVDRRVTGIASTLFAWGCTTEFRILAPGLAPLELPRLDAWYFRDAQRFADWGTSRFRAWLWARREARRLRRLARRMTTP